MAAVWGTVPVVASTQPQAQCSACHAGDSARQQPTTADG